MADRFSRQKRSELMSRIRNKDSKIEMYLRGILWRMGFRYRKNSNKYFGKPDLVIPKYKTVIFVDSCFWHGCKKHGSFPKTRKEFWVNKLNRNRMRDLEVTRYYKNLNEWHLIRIWEHELDGDTEKIMNKIGFLVELMNNKVSA